MSTSVAMLESIAPQYAGDARAETFLEIAASLHTPSAWGAQYAYAMALYAAHLLTQADREAEGSAASSGPVTSRRAGDLAETYATPSSSGVAGDDELKETSYGRRYLGVRRTRAASKPFVAGAI